MDMQSIKREEAKQAYLAERRRKEEKKRLTKEKAETRWRRKMENSPFLVDLVADHERIDEVSMAVVTALTAVRKCNGFVCTRKIE